MPKGVRLLHLPLTSHAVSALVWLHFVSDIVIAIAYVAIPITLLYFVRRRQDSPFNWMFLWFGLFTIGCAVNHAMEAWNAWQSNYLIASGVKVAIALASVASALLIVRLIPHASALPGSGRLEQLSRRLLHVQDEERRVIAKEVHDGIGQYMGALSLGLATLRGSIEENNSESKQILNDCQTLIADASREIRTLSYLLHPPMFEQMGLRPSLQWLIRGYTERSGIRVSLEMPPDFGRLKPEIELALLRLVQEALSNIHRHSGSPTAVVRLVRSPKEVVLELRDMGRGMRLRFLESTGCVGVGIPGMRERVRELNGRFVIDSAPDMGVTVRASLPVGVGPLI